MRSTIIAAAFAATAMAVPFAQPEVITAYETDVVYMTNVVTVTAGAPPPATTVAAADAAPSDDGNGSGHNGWHWPHKHKTHKSKQTKTRTRTLPPSPPPAYTPPADTPPAYTPPAEPTATYAPAPEPTTQEPEPEPTPTQISGYSGMVVAHHNIHRSNHSAPDVKWDDGLAATAQKIADTCVYGHDTEMDGGGYGQNIAAGVESGNVSAIITDLFYNGEIGYYGDMYGSEPAMGEFHAWGHFSQIIWKDTTAVGCATAHCPGGLADSGENVAPYFTVCNYSPPGNYGGEYTANVLAPKGEQTVEWNYGM